MFVNGLCDEAAVLSLPVHCDALAFMSCVSCSTCVLDWLMEFVVSSHHLTWVAITAIIVANERAINQTEIH